MSYDEYIKKAIEYIEENLQNDLAVEEVARYAGYSKCHFIGKFRDHLGLTPADYIRKRRISEIVRRMEHDPRPICDIAFEYGFNSKENFIRAFKKEHRILPTEFRYTQNSLKLYDRIDLNASSFSVDARLQVLEPFSLTVYMSDEDFPPNFWNRYNVGHLSEKLSGGKTVEDFGISSWNVSENKLDYYIGIKTEEALGDTNGTLTLDVPGGLYAVFETPDVSHFEFVNTIHMTWDYIKNVWLPQNGFRRTGTYDLESYVEKSRRYSETIYIPIEKDE